MGFKYEVIETESQEKLLSKSGKLLGESALIAKFEKLAKKMQISISYKGNRISYKSLRGDKK